MLQLIANVNGERRAWPLEGEALGIGRSSRNTVQIADPTVSKEHAMLVRAGDGWSIRDLGSRNGTRVNGAEAREALPVRDGDTLEIGKVIVRVGSAEETPETRFSTSVGLSSSVRILAREVLAAPRAMTGAGSPVMKVLADAARMLVLPKPLRETCEEVLGFVEQAIPATRFVILLREPGGGEPVQIASRVRGGNPNEPLAISRKILDTVLEDCTSVITADAAQDPRFEARESIIAMAIHSAMAVPLFDNEAVLGVLYADSRDFRLSFGPEQLELLTLLGNMAAVKITNARLLEQEQKRQRMEQELATATRIQRTLLPEPPRLDGWQCHARLDTCYEVGGDLYDFHRRADGRLVFLIGDVSGKGMGAALLMSSTISSARTLYDQCADPAELVSRLNGVLQRGTEPGHFVTLFLGVLDPASGALEFVNAGHNAPLVVGRDGVRELTAGGVPVGILAGADYDAGATRLAPGELLALFTDGIPEATREGQFYDDERLRESLVALAGEPSLDALSDALLARVEAFLAGAPRTDDVTLLLLRRD